MTTGLICAIPQELIHLREVLETAGTRIVAHTEFEEGFLDGHRVVLAGAGMGKVNAALVTTLLVSTFGCSTVVLSGVAGGLDSSLSIGDVVIADRVVQSDAGMITDRQLQVYQAGHVAFINPTERLGYSTYPAMLARIKDRLTDYRLPLLPHNAGGRDQPPTISYGTVLTGDQYLHCELTRQRLHRELGGVAIEMEGGAVAQAAEAFDVPWLVIRALSDLAGRDAAFDFNAFAEGVAVNSAAIVRHILPVL